MYASLSNHSSPDINEPGLFESTENHKYLPSPDNNRVAKRLIYEDHAHSIDERDELVPESLEITKTPGTFDPQEVEVSVSSFVGDRDRLKARFLDATRINKNALHLDGPKQISNNSNSNGIHIHDQSQNYTNILNSVDDNSFIEAENKCRPSHKSRRDNSEKQRESDHYWSTAGNNKYDKLNNSLNDSGIQYNPKKTMNPSSSIKAFRPTSAGGKILRSFSVDKQKFLFDPDSSFVIDAKPHKYDQHNNSVNVSRIKHQLLNDSSMLDECYKNILKERKERVQAFKVQAAERYQNRTMKHELENQMKMLENRVKRLQDEDFNIQKSIKKTEETTKRAISAKQRYQEDLLKMENLKQKRLADQERARQRILEEKMRREERLKNSMRNALNNKLEAAYEVKKRLYQDSEKMSENYRKDIEKKYKLHNSTFNFEKSLKNKKTKQQSLTKEQMNENHLKYLTNEHQKTKEIQSKIKQLAAIEESLINRIKTTQKLQIQVEGYMQRVVNTKVDKRTPLKF